MLSYNVYFSDDFKHNLEKIFHARVLPKDPAFYVHIPTKTDPSLAPKNKHVIYVLVPVPSLEAEVDWLTAIEQTHERVLERMQAIMDLKLNKKIETEAVFTPRRFSQSFQSHRQLGVRPEPLFLLSLAILARIMSVVTSKASTLSAPQLIPVVVYQWSRFLVSWLQNAYRKI
ncbi:hypothetical protein IT415_01435 [bacterium]|nr:hypothetical protein [bacterium]